MYTFVREVTFRTMADMMRGLPVAAEIVKFYKDVAGTEIRVQRALTGSPVCIRYVAELDSLDEWQRIQEQVAQNPVFHKLLAEMGPLVDGSRTHDQIWRT
ncbi:hypothetical protein PE066_06790 [Ramlibacter tataouinensis]|uniref:hypothetical protein n=1 Tax=Ramlibacter tataouinensis TaxID=94132 RepID=UPI0022F3E7A6|nr:hypothetical protein [Ramlibacter tataouinensis]WBY03234.1 hypothetical protein PE066_06790 [Ramlibacter tataouinensis]